MKVHPLVTVGIPIYNAELVIDKCIQSLLGQTFKNFQIIISDNSSNDMTKEICHSYVNLDPRIKYIRQSHNIGMIPNFNFVLKQANSKYFMWAAADDVRDETFLEKAVEVLEKNDDCMIVLSHFQIWDYRNNVFVSKVTPSSYCNDLPLIRLDSVLQDLHPNLMYGLFRVRENINYLFLEKIDWADVLWVARIVAEGKYYIIPEILYTIGIYGSKRKPYSLEGKYLTLTKFRLKYKTLLKRYTTSWLSYLIHTLKLYYITYRSMKVVNREISLLGK